MDEMLLIKFLPYSPRASGNVHPWKDAYGTGYWATEYRVRLAELSRALPALELSHALTVLHPHRKSNCDEASLGPDSWPTLPRKDLWPFNGESGGGQRKHAVCPEACERLLNSPGQAHPEQNDAASFYAERRCKPFAGTRNGRKEKAKREHPDFVGFGIIL
ncbi:hypothetical protein L1887_44348 [Cichorium endivia]|nr:hypothetical protein L1887_44348 [Cichorium endivia]